MKIGSGAPLNPTSSVNQPQQVKASTGSDENKKAEQSARNQRASQRRDVLRRWFSQIGIQPSDPSDSSVELIKQVGRREQIIAYNKLRNLQRILDLALDVNIDGDLYEHVDPDWFFTFSSLAEDIYSPAMQKLWSRIAAVELSQPGSFSIRTLHLLKQLTQRDADIFSRAASIASKRNNEATPRIIIGYAKRTSLWRWFTPYPQQHLNLAECGVTYPDLLTLIELGLIYASEIETGELTMTHREQWRCGDIRFSLSPHAKGTALVYYKFTRVGSELFRLANKRSNSRYYEQLQGLLKRAFEVI